MLATESMGKYVVCFPLAALYPSSAEVALAACLGENHVSFTGRK
jgi:hypothetical protein